MGRGEILEKGFPDFADAQRVRGFGRPQVPSEIRIQMMYAVGSGARALWSYIDATECCGGLVFHGTQELPELWAAIGGMSRTFRQVAGDINLSHPLVWAQADEPKLWVRTLACGEDAALVCVVNEDYRCDHKGFLINPAGNVTFAFLDLPWLATAHVARVLPDGLEHVPCQRADATCEWRVSTVEDVALFRVTG